MTAKHKMIGMIGDTESKNKMHCIKVDKSTEIEACSIFPARYQPSPSFDAAEAVCSVTHIPPKDSIPEQRINRRGTEWIWVNR